MTVKTACLVASGSGRERRSPSRRHAPAPQQTASRSANDTKQLLNYFS